MQSPSPVRRVLKLLVLCSIAAIIGYVVYSDFIKTERPKNTADTAPKDSSAEASVDLTDSQLGAVKIATVGTVGFQVKVDAVGSVAYHEKDAVKGSKTSKFVVANVRESDSTLIRIGEPVQVRTVVYPGHVFEGRISAVGVTVYDSGGNPAVDPNTHRIAARCEIADPKDELYPGMLATITIQVGNLVKSVAVPENGLVREGDGTMTAWVTSDRHRFTKRTVKVGLQQDGYDQILEGLKAGELVATDGALFLDNELTGSPSD